MQALRVERIYHKEGEPVVICGLEIYVCPECGCEAMPLHTARLVENVLKGEVGTESEVSVWDELVELGRQISQEWQSSQTSVEILSEMRD
jgi:hypothetical protein